MSKNPFLGAGITAAGSSMLAGLLVQAETDAGEINHALQLAIDYMYLKPGFTPSSGSMSGTDASTTPAMPQSIR